MIKCYVNSKSKEVSIYLNNNLKESVILNQLDYKKEVDNEDTIFNILKLINRLSINLKVSYNAKEVDTLIIIDNKDTYDLLCPEGSLITKLSKSMKKNIKNNELKLLLGSTLYELNSVKNIKIKLNENISLGEDSNMFLNNNSNGLRLADLKPQNNKNNTSDKKDDDFIIDFDDDDFEIDLETEVNKEEKIDFEIDLETEVDKEEDDDDFEINLEAEVDKKEDDDDFEIDLEAEVDKKEDDDFEINLEAEVDKEEEDKNVLKMETNKKDNFKVAKNISEKNNKVMNKQEMTKEINLNNDKNKESNLNMMLTEEFSFIEKYINERISILNNKIDELKAESLNINLNISDLNLDEEIIVQNFKKSMEMRLRLKAIKNSCKIYSNIRTQLENDLSKFQ